MIDPRTAGRAEALRAACTLPITRIFGSLVGRSGGRPWSVAMEPGGRHAAVMVSGGVERWDLDALECVGRWPLPRDLFPGNLVCVGETPAGLRYTSDCKLWHGLAPALRLSIRTTDGGMRFHFTDPPTRSVFQMVDGEVPVLVRAADGSPFCRVPDGLRRWCDPDGTFVVVERSRTAFDVLAVAADSLTPRLVTTLTVDEALAGEARVAIDGPGRRVALVFEKAAVVGAWDRWPSARTFPLLAHRWTDLEFCAGGRTLVLCMPGCVVRLDTKTGRTGEAWFAVADSERFAPAIDAATGRVLHADAAGLCVIDRSTVRTRIADHGPLVTAAAAAFELLVTSASDGSIRARDRTTGEVRLKLQCPTRESHAVAVTSDLVIAVGVADGVLRWSLRTGQPRPRIGLKKTSDRLLPRILLTPDGRQLALARRDARREGVDVFVVDLDAGRARQLERIDLQHGRSSALCLGLDADATVLRGATVADYGRRLELWTRPLAGGRRRPAGDSKGGPGDPLTISSDGKLLWWQGLTEFVVSVTAAAGVADTPLARWPVAHPVSACCAGRSLLAVTVNGSLTILVADGRSLATKLPKDCEPLTFADDDRALWVRDPMGMLVELAIPETLLRDEHPRSLVASFDAD